MHGCPAAGWWLRAGPALVGVRRRLLGQGPGFSVVRGLSMDMLRAVQSKDFATAERIRERFAALEALRDGISPVRVLHAAVRLAGIADTGPLQPYLANLDVTSSARSLPRPKPSATRTHASCGPPRPEFQRETTMTYVPASDRYERLEYRHTGRSGLKTRWRRSWDSRLGM